MSNKVISVISVIDYIEANLTKKLDLEQVAQAVHYSKYHLHRVFRETIGLSIHEYIVRRKLSEAAKLLVFSDCSILEIALLAGYESQQAFSAVFKEMYKKTPYQYRENEEYYPLQLRFKLSENPNLNPRDWQAQIQLARKEDLPLCLELVYQIIDGFPNFQEEEYLASIESFIEKKQVLILKEERLLKAMMAFDRSSGNIEFLGVHPQYRKLGIAKAFLKKLIEEKLTDQTPCITTFRKGDKADTGYRKVWEHMGFAEAELLKEYGYPTQRMIYLKEGTDE